MASAMEQVASPREAASVKEQFKDAGFTTLDRDQFIRLMTKLNPAFRDDELTRIADGALSGAFTGGGKMCCSALVDYLFGIGASVPCTQPPAIIMGDLGSGKTSAYLFKRTEQGGIQVKELSDGGQTDLPSLAGCPFEEWAASFSRAAGEYLTQYPAHIGATQWYREMPEQQQVDLGLRLWDWGQESFPHGFRLLEVTGLNEATFESTACRHACEAVLHLVPDIILSSGTGSMQCTAGGVSSSISLDTKMWSKRPREDIPAYREAAIEAMKPLQPLVQRESNLALLLGASWYAVVTAGMAESKSEPFQMSRQQAVIKLEAHASKPDTCMRDAVNIWRIIEVLSMMSVEDVVFGRNWMVHGENFRTTWSVGYFLDGCQ